MASTHEHDEDTQNRTGLEEDKRTPEEKLSDRLTERVFEHITDLAKELLEPDGKSRLFITVTEELIDYMEKKSSRWTQPWTNGIRLMQLSASSRLPYSGLNRLRLAATSQDRGYDSPYWITPYRADKLGHPVREVELDKWALVFSVFRSDWDDGLRFMVHVVYNLEQCEGWEKMPMAWSRPPLPAPQAMINSYVAHEMSRSNFRLEHSNIRDAYYAPAADTIVLPVVNRFSELTDYYATAFHEIAHSTGPIHRLGRRHGQNWEVFGSHGYAEEEIVAELAAAFLAVETGITNDLRMLEDSAAYLRYWSDVASKKVKKGDTMEKTIAYSGLWLKHSDADAVVSYVLNRRKLRDKVADRWRKREQVW